MFDKLEATCALAKVGSRTLVYRQEILGDDGKPRATAVVTMACFDVRKRAAAAWTPEGRAELTARIDPEAAALVGAS